MQFASLMMTIKRRQRVENIMDSSGCILMFTIGKSNLINCDKRIAASKVGEEEQRLSKL